MTAVESFELRHPGIPVGKGRPRVNMRTRRVYTPETTLMAEEAWRSTWILAGRPQIEGRVAIGVSIVLAVVRPASHLLRDGSVSAQGRREPVPIGRRDVDNCCKLILDALSGLAWRDDALVARLLVERVWSDVAYTHLVASVLDLAGMKTREEA